MNHNLLKNLFTALALMAAANLTAADWVRKKAPIMSEWGEKINPDKVWTEYPRPQMERSEWMSLNGPWDYCKKKSVDLSYNLSPTAFNQKILVPFPIESALSGIMDTNFEENTQSTFVYQRTFKLPKAYKGRHILLHFGAVDWKCAVYVNGQKAGSHSGGSDPFSMDITPLLRDGEEQEIQVTVTDPTNHGGQPLGKQTLKPGGCFYTPVTGIWQTVWIEPVDAAHVSSYNVTSDIDAGTVSLTVESASTSATADIIVKDGRKTVATLTGIPVNSARTVSIPDAKLWAPGSPHLYDMDIHLYHNGTQTDRVKGYFGMRKISRGMVDGHPCMLLNNKPLYQFGVLDQGWWPDGLLTPPSDEGMRYDIEVVQSLGMNMIRKHIKVEPARWYYYCDKMGMLVWQDMPSKSFDENGSIGSKEFIRQNFYDECTRIVNTLKNHPCIVVWVAYNEGWGQYASGNDSHTRRGVEAIRKADDTRLINAASGWVDFEAGDIIDQHSYPVPSLQSNPLNERVAVCGEYGGITLKVDGHLWKGNDMEYTSVADSKALAERFNAYTVALQGLQEQGIWASVYTQTSDVEQELNGLLTYDRKVFKIAPEEQASVREEILRTIHNRSRQTVVVDAADTSSDEVWSYTTVTPSGDWYAPSFDDSRWDKGQAGFGAGGPPNTFVRSAWNTSDIYIRRHFSIGNLSQAQINALQLWLYQDDDCEVYLNGVKAYEVKGWTTRYVAQPITPKALATLKPNSDNVMAIHAHQGYGGQYIDAGLRYTEYIPVEEYSVGPMPGRQAMPEVKATDSVYLMSYFKASAQHLFYAYSRDGKTWTDINGSRPVFNAYDDEVWLRDPYLHRVTHNGKTKFHLIHTWGWDHPALFHWESDDLIHWTAANGGTRTDDGKIMLMDGHDGGPVSPNAWAPEFTYDGQTGTFYLYWSSRIGDRQVHHYCTTKDWLTFSTPAVYFDPGFTAIDMTILKEGDTYYAYYKDERNGEKTIRCATSKSLDPRVQRFEGSTPLLPSRYIEVEGPEVFPAIGGKGWFLYFDKFNGDRGVSYTGCTDPSQHKWYPIPDDEIRNPTEVKHGSVEIISTAELEKLLEHFK